MILPAWLSEGLPVLLFGIGTVLLTLFILSQAIAIFGRVVNRANGPPPVASRGTVTVSEGEEEGGPGRAGGRELLRAAAAAAAIEAYLQAEEIGPGVDDSPTHAHGPAPGQGSRAQGSTWAGAGRLAQMNERQQIVSRRGRTPR